MAPKTPADEPRLSRAVVDLFAHDVRNPLAALVANLHHAAESLPEAPTDIRETLNESLALCDVVDRFIDNVSTISSLGDDAPEPARVQLEAIMTRALSKARRFAAVTGIEFSVDVIDEAQRRIVLGSQRLLERTLENLLADAIEQAPPGTPVRLSVRASETSVDLAIIDSGPALDEASAARAVGLADQRSYKASRGSRYGRGLALPAAHIAAGRAGATIRFDRDGDRARATLSIPLGR